MRVNPNFVIIECKLVLFHYLFACCLVNQRTNNETFAITLFINCTNILMFVYVFLLSEKRQFCPKHPNLLTGLLAPKTSMSWNINRHSSFHAKTAHLLKRVRKQVLFKLCYFFFDTILCSLKYLDSKQLKKVFCASKLYNYCMKGWILIARLLTDNPLPTPPTLARCSITVNLEVSKLFVFD